MSAGVEQDYGQAASKLRAAARDLQSRLGARLFELGDPLGRQALEGGSAEMPHRGGLAGLIRADGQVDVQMSLRDRMAAVDVELSGGADLRSLERGELNHKVFDVPGRTPTWVRQRVPAGAFSRAVVARARRVGQAGDDAVREVLSRI